MGTGDAGQTTTGSMDVPVDFDAFWRLYPRRVARKAALREWERLSVADQSLALAAIAVWAPIFSRREWDKIPHGSTWIHGERWLDELPPSRQGPIPAAQEPARVRAAPAERVGAAQVAALRKVVG